MVQDDSDDMMEQGKTSMPAELANRVTFQKHDYFAPQPVSDAGAFLVRQCMHNQDDDGAVKMMKGLVPALEKSERGTPVLINDIVLPELNAAGKLEENALRQMDMTMLVILGSRERTPSQFQKVMKRADPRLEVVKVHASGPLGLVEVQLVQ